MKSTIFRARPRVKQGMFTSVLHFIPCVPLHMPMTPARCRENFMLQVSASTSIHSNLSTRIYHTKQIPWTNEFPENLKVTSRLLSNNHILIVYFWTTVSSISHRPAREPWYKSKLTVFFNRREAMIQLLSKRLGSLGHNLLFGLHEAFDADRYAYWRLMIGQWAISSSYRVSLQWTFLTAISHKYRHPRSDSSSYQIAKTTKISNLFWKHCPYLVWRYGTYHRFYEPLISIWRHLSSL